MKRILQLRLTIALSALLFSSLAVMAQYSRTVGFIRPGEQQPVCAYLLDFVDVYPNFPNGETALNSYINSERVYPRDAYEQGIQGRVICSFIIDTDGSINNITILRAPCHSLGMEAARIISNMPRWESGRIGNEKVPVLYRLTIPFRL